VIGAAGAPVADPRTPTGEPGLRAPYVRLLRDGVELSTTDLCTGEFTLLTGPSGAGWAADVTTYRVGTDVEDPDGRFLTAFGLTTSGATLIRPDGFVAWRATSLSPAPHEELRQVLAELLAVPARQPSTH
jgi:putative polyketide hydroxylase